MKFGEAPDFSPLLDPVETAEPAPAAAATVADVVAVIDLLAEAEKNLAMKSLELERRLIDEPMRQTFTKASIFNEFVAFVRAEFVRTSSLRKMLLEHQPPKEAETECVQCRKMIPLSLLRAHNQWHLQLSLEAAAEK